MTTEQSDAVAAKTPERNASTELTYKVTPTKPTQRVNRYRNQYHAPCQLGAAPTKIVAKVKHNSTPNSNSLSLLADMALMTGSCLMYEKFKVVCDNCNSGPRQGKRCKMFLLAKKRDHEDPAKCG